MNTAVTPEVETIEQLDFDPTCTYRDYHDGPQCTNPAAWANSKRCGHVGFVCEPHKQYLLNSWRQHECGVCRTVWISIHEAVIEWRRL